MLTVFAIEKSKPREKPYLLSDGNGLHLLVNPNGSKLWRFRYRIGGKQNLLSLGSFPEVSLADARDKRDAARKLESVRSRHAIGRDESASGRNTQLQGRRCSNRYHRSIRCDAPRLPC